MALKLIGEVSLDGSGFERGLNRLGHAAGHNLKSLVAGAFGVYSIHQAIHRTIESAEELVTASRRLDMTIEQLQIMRQAAKENSVEFGKLETALEKINVARAKALGGDEKSLSAFSQLGVNREMLKTKSAAELFMGPMSQKVSTTNAQDLAAPMREIFLKGFGSLIPVLRTDFDELGHHMAALGSLMDGNVASSMKKMKDSFDLLSNVVAAHLAPVLVGFANILLGIMGKIGGTSAGLGAATSNVRPDQLKDIASVFVFTGNLRKGVRALMDVIRELKPGEAAPAFHSVTEKWDKMIEEMMAKQNAPVPQPGAEDDTTAKTGRAKASDSLVSAGNFLGSTGAGLANLQQQHLQVAQKTLSVQEQQKTLLEQINKGVSQFGMGMIGFPL